jgi:hypothetical protein
VNGALFAAHLKSPWFFAVLALATILASCLVLWLVMNHSYALSLRSSSGMQLDLAPAVARQK